MSRSWFFELSEKPADDFLNVMVSECSGLEIVERTFESYDATQESYEIFVVRRGRDRMRIVVGSEVDKQQPMLPNVWWILATREPWWRSPWNSLPDVLIPVLTKKLKMAETGSS